MRTQLAGTIAMAMAAVVMSGCEGAGTAARSKTGQGAVAGGLLGAGTGAILGHQTGRAGEGAAIGAGLGAIGGGLVGRGMDAQEKKAQQQAIPPATSPNASASHKKFCPIGGETYGEDIKYCPTHGVELRFKE